MEWWQEYFSDVDSGDIPRMAAWFAPDINMCFGNWPQVHGREAATAALSAFLGRLQSVRHATGLSLPGEDTVFVEARVSYTIDEKLMVTVPSATFLRRGPAGITELRIYLDPAPLLTALEHAASVA
jgi:SnoaL-like domain